MERNRLELLPGVFLTLVRRAETEPACFRAALLRQLSREEAAMNALLPEALLFGTQRHPDGSLADALSALHAKAEPLVRGVGEVQAVGFTAVFDHDPAQFAALMQVLAGILLAPDTRFGQLKKEAVERALQRWDETDEAEDDPFAAMREHMCCFEDYAVARLGNLEECREIRYRKLTRQYQQVLSSSPVEICYCGREAPEKIAECLRSALSTLPRGEIDYEIGTDVRMNAVEDDVRRVTETMDVNQARLVMGFRLGEVMEEPDRATLSMFNTVFGSGVTSKLFVHVRERLQLCYSVASIVDVHKGTLFAAAGIDASKASEAEAEILHQLQEVRDGNITDEELEYAKAGILSDLTAMLDSPGAMESFFFSNAIDGSDLTPEEYAVRVREVTKEDVSAVAKSIVPDLFYLLRGEDK